MKYLIVALVMLICIGGCDDNGGGGFKKQKFDVIETIQFIPSKLTVDVELLQTQGIVLLVTVIEQFEVTQIGYKLYSETERWLIKDQIPSGPKYPHQINQFIFKYNGFTIDTRTTITLIRVAS